MTLAFSPDGKKLAAMRLQLLHGQAERADDIVLWDVSTRKKVLTCGAKRHGVICAFAFSGDGNSLLAEHRLFRKRDPRDTRIETWEITVHLWDTTTGQEIAQVGEKQPWIGSQYERCPPGQQLSEIGARPVTLPRPSNFGTAFVVGQPAAGHRMIRSQSGRFYVLPNLKCAPVLASASRDGTIRILDAETEAELGQVTDLVGKEIRTLAISPDGTKLAAAGDGSRNAVSTIFVWDLTAVTNRTVAPQKSLFSQALETIWSDLASKQAGSKAYRAMRTLIQAPSEQTVPFLRKRLDGILDSQRYSRILRELGHDNAKMRTSASLELETLGWPMIPLIDATLADNPTIDLRRRLENARGVIIRAAPDWEAGGFRVIDVLQHIGSPDALRVLTAISHTKALTPWHPAAYESAVSPDAKPHPAYVPKSGP